MSVLDQGSREQFTDMWRQIAERVAPDDLGLQALIIAFGRVVVTQGELDAHEDAGH